MAKPNNHDKVIIEQGLIKRYSSANIKILQCIPFHIKYGITQFSNNSFAKYLRAPIL